MSGIVNKVKNALSSDHSSTSTTHGTTGAHTTGTHAGTAEGVAGPHSSRAANAADPRVDSDLDGSRHVGGTGVSPHVGTGGSANTGAYTSGTTGSGLTGTHGTHNTHGTTHTGTTGGLAGTHGTTHNTTAGPHSSNLANKADPRVDSDLDGSSRIGGNTGAYNSGTTGSGLTGTHGTHNTHGTTHTGTAGGYTAGTTGSGLTGTHGTTHNTTAGPHSSNLANKADPRVDSDLDGSRNLGAASHGTTGVAGTHNTTHGTTGLGGTHAGNTNYTGTHGTTAHTGTHGGISHSTNAGPHDSNLANKADPRVDSDLDGRGNRHGATTTGAGAGVLGAHGSHATAGSGTAQNTAGPHNSDLLNKLDPRVDSDRDGSKTFGGNKTHANTHKDVHDAAQVPPSVFAAHQGEPQILHGDHGHDRARRHSVATEQEK